MLPIVALKRTIILRKQEKVTPDKLYVATKTQRFIKLCIENEVKWAIFSDKYGIWFSNGIITAVLFEE